MSGPFSGTADLVGGGLQLTAPSARATPTRSARPSRAHAGRPVDAPPLTTGDVPAVDTALRARPTPTPSRSRPGGSGVPGPDDYALGPYARVRDLARTVAADAPTAYAAVNRVESFLRRSTSTTSRRPTRPACPTAPPARPTAARRWSTSSSSAGAASASTSPAAMAVMLRSIGIPARVAVGYGTGRWDNGREQWVVLDRDAHSWVEVWFPGRGWLPFDPTPGRSAPNPASVSSPDYAPSPFDIDLGGIEKAAVAPRRPTPPPRSPRTRRPSSRSRRRRPPRPPPAGAAAGRRGRGRCSRWSCRRRRPGGPRRRRRGRAATATSGRA